MDAIGANGSLHPIDHTLIKVPLHWAQRPVQLADDRVVSVCGGCAWPHWCAGRASCHRAKVFGVARTGPIDAGHHGRTE